MVPNLTIHAWAQLAQFKHHDLVWSGDLVSKAGKRELMALGLVSGQDGNYYLTKDGRELAARIGQLTEQRQ